MHNTNQSVKGNKGKITKYGMARIDAVLRPPSPTSFITVGAITIGMVNDALKRKEVMQNWRIPLLPQWV